MNAPAPGGGRLLGQPDPVPPEIRIWPLAAVTLKPGGFDVGDATHHLLIASPFAPFVMAVPFNVRSLLTVGGAMIDAADGTESSLDTRKDTQ